MEHTGRKQREEKERLGLGGRYLGASSYLHLKCNNNWESRVKGAKGKDSLKGKGEILGNLVYPLVTYVLNGGADGCKSKT